MTTHLPVPSRAATTGVWPGDEPRLAASDGFDVLADAHVPVPLMSTPAEGDTRWAADLTGLAVQFLDGMPVDRTTRGWRLARGSSPRSAADLRVETSRFRRTLDALGEYGEGFAGRFLLTLPGPWELLHALDLPGGNPALSDPGARRDVVQAYAAGVLGLRAEFGRLFGRGTSGRGDEVLRLRLREDHLDAILTGTVPTASGLRTLPAVPDLQVAAGLRSFLARCGADPLLSLPRAGFFEIAGKRIPHGRFAAEVLPAPPDTAEMGTARSALDETPAEASVASGTDRPGLVVPLHTLDDHGWEQLAVLVEEGRGVWVGLPAGAGDRPGEVSHWTRSVSVPWGRIGMGTTGLRDLGVLTGWEAPHRVPPVLPVAATTAAARGQAELASRVAAALAAWEG
ncbi:hypothetical protein [Brevibacterium litoralis]|uniref:hypothetical protein n=1 Tax=Brevibacterium litoralis TaxID=3138935 RepID=UPI0032EF73D2